MDAARSAAAAAVYSGDPDDDRRLLKEGFLDPRRRFLLSLMHLLCATETAKCALTCKKILSGRKHSQRC